MFSRVSSRVATLSKWRLAAVLGAALLGYFVISFGGLALTGFQLNERAASLEREVQDLRVDNERLENEIRSLQTDDVLEKLAREELGWTRAGETGVVVVPKKPEAILPVAESPTKRRDDTPNWRRWWDLFFGS